MSLRIHLLGDFLLLEDGRAVPAVGTPRLQSLLSYLLIHRDAAHPRQRLAFMLWPDSSELQAPTNLRQLVHRLRATLPAMRTYLLAGSRSLQWNAGAPFTLDVQDFERLLAEVDSAARSGLGADECLRKLHAAVELYQGDLLPDLYDEWVIRERERLRQRYIDAVEALVGTLRAVGKHGDARVYAERLKSCDPLRESTYRTIMELCLVGGDHAGAARVYQECAAVLEEELGVQPSPATQATYRRVLAEVADREDAAVSLPEPNPGRNGSSRRVPTNLPAPANAFVGRQAELAAILTIMSRHDVRLLTLVGPPGVGKTRLALQAAASLLGGFPDGVYFVDLSPIVDPSLLAPTIAQVLGVREEPGWTIEQRLADHLGDKQIMLVLDNFEHVLEGAVLVSSLLARCHGLKALAASREALQLYGEYEFPVPPLELPSPTDAAAMDPAHLGEYSAPRLFVERAAGVQYGFALTRENAQAVIAICRKLDALPLAIELAASRVRLWPPALLLRRLEERLDILASGARDLPARQRTLRGAIAWSYDLLGPAERNLFARMAVFQGGCTIEALQAVCGGRDDDGEVALAPVDVRAVAESLLSKSLLWVRPDAGVIMARPAPGTAKAWPGSGR